MKTIKTIIGDLKFRQDGTSEGSALVCPQMQSGMPESLFSIILPSQITPVIAFIIIIVALTVRPEGLFSRS